MSNVPNSVVIPLDKVWDANDFHHFIMATGFATGMIDENATAEMKELYQQTATMCEKFISIYNQKMK